MSRAADLPSAAARRKTAAARKKPNGAGRGTPPQAQSGGTDALSLTDRAYKRLEEMIVTLQLAPGEVVSEAALSKRLGIGRTPIREGLQRLRPGAAGGARWSASRIGVRPIPSGLRIPASDTTSPGASCSVTIISSRRL